MQTLPIPTEAGEHISRSPRFSILNLFRRNPERYEGVPPINIYLLRTLFTLVVLFVGYDAGSRILTHTGSWTPVEAAAWCMWAAFSVLCFIGLLRPLKMLPLVLFEIVYKVVWLALVAYPLWTRGELEGSPAEGMTKAFLWVVLPIAAMPWGYFVRTYIGGRRRKAKAAEENRQAYSGAQLTTE